MPFELACCLVGTDALTYNHLVPLARHPLVSRLWIVRPSPTAHGAIPKARYVLTPDLPKPRRWLAMQRACDRLARRPGVRAFVSFNPIPYGLIAALSAWRAGKAMHFGFIGLDWHRDASQPRGRWLNPLLRRGDLITATGPSMRQEMLVAGYPADRVMVLPHGLDLDRYPVAPPGPTPYAAVFTGRLVALKRVDLMLRALALLRRTRPGARLCVVGEGPARPGLERLAGELGLTDAVDFTGYVSDVAPYVAAAQTVLIASTSEGFPYSLVEGLCRGRIPIATPVGTIPDHLTDGESALFVDPTPESLADALDRVLGDDALRDRLRAGALALRSRYGFARATAAWDPWLRALAR